MGSDSSPVSAATPICVTSTVASPSWIASSTAPPSRGASRPVSDRPPSWSTSTTAVLEACSAGHTANTATAARVITESPAKSAPFNE